MNISGKLVACIHKRLTTTGMVTNLDRFFFILTQNIFLVVPPVISAKFQEAY